MVTTNSFWSLKGEVDYVDDWFLMSNPVPIFLILMGYWVFVLKLGPEFMKNKPAYNMGPVLAFYNMAQVVFSCYLGYVGTNLILSKGLLNTSCGTADDSTTIMITSGTYAYLIAKITELLDTVFFTFKKNYHQITFLHVYHHSIMVLCTWFTLKYEPSYNPIFAGTVNSSVHVVMYAYYCLSVIPGISKYLWWKKYITKMQIVQFILIIIQAGANYYISECPPSYPLLAAILCNALIFTGLFINFYFNTYKPTKKID